jgi:hypothetical protein
MVEQLEFTPQGASGNPTSYQYDQYDRLATEHFTNRMHPSFNAISTYEYDAQATRQGKRPAAVAVFESQVPSKSK